MTPPTDPIERKQRPIYSGVLRYFPNAIAEVANCSYVGNEQHHAGAPLHWDKSKSTDEADCLLRHLMQAGTLDSDGVRHTAKAAWRALALLERELEAEGLEADRADDQSSTHPAATSFKTQWEPRHLITDKCTCGRKDFCAPYCGTAWGCACSAKSNPGETHAKWCALDGVTNRGDQV